MAVIIGTIQIRRGTTTQWANANPVLASGEWGLDTDLGQVKIGDGAKDWATLPFFKGEKGEPGPPGQWTQITQAAYDALDPPDPDTLFVVIG